MLGGARMFEQTHLAYNAAYAQATPQPIPISPSWAWISATTRLLAVAVVPRIGTLSTPSPQRIDQATVVGAGRIHRQSDIRWASCRPLANQPVLGDRRHHRSPRNWWAGQCVPEKSAGRQLRWPGPPASKLPATRPLLAEFMVRARMPRRISGLRSGCASKPVSGDTMERKTTDRDPEECEWAMR